MPRMTRAVLAAQAEALRRRFRALKGRLGQSQRAADDLRQSESRPRSLFEHADDLIVSCRLDGTITDVNRATEKTLGWSRGELIGHNIERRHAEDALRGSEERYRTLFDNANDSILTFTLDGDVTAVNRAYERLTGWTRDELVGRNWQKLVAPVDRERMADRTRRALAGERLPSLFEVHTLCQDGRAVPLEGRTRMVRDAHGTPTGFQGIYRDITERKRAEEALRESEARYRTMFDDAEERRRVLDRPSTGWPPRCRSPGTPRTACARSSRACTRCSVWPRPSSALVAHPSRSRRRRPDPVARPAPRTGPDRPPGVPNWWAHCSSPRELYL